MGRSPRARQSRPPQARGQPGESQSPRSLAVLRPGMQAEQDATGSHQPPPAGSSLPLQGPWLVALMTTPTARETFS